MTAIKKKKKLLPKIRNDHYGLIKYGELTSMQLI